MKFWLSRTSTVPLHDQLRTQLIMAISSADLAPGEKLASAPEMARRFHVHANTVLAVYRDLAESHWIEWRRGSGYYVRKRTPQKEGEETDLDRLTAAFLEAAVHGGHSLEAIRAAVLNWIARRPADRILVIEPDLELRAILLAEIGQAVGVRTEGAGLEVSTDVSRLTGALTAALPDHAEEVRVKLPPETPFIALQSRSVMRSMIGHPRPPADTSITVISHWPDFLKWAHITLTGVGLDPSAFDLRDARRKGWDRGLGPQSFIVTDSITASRMPSAAKPIVFRVVSDESLIELRARFPA